MAFRVLACGLLLLGVGCGAVRQEIFSLLQAEEPKDLGDAGRPPADARMPMPVDAGQDADVTDTGLPIDAGELDAGLPSECPMGPYTGQVMCDFGDPQSPLVGTVEFTIGAVNDVTRKAQVEGTVHGYVPVSSDDLTPAVELSAVSITGDVTCFPGLAPYLDATSAGISLAPLPGSLPSLVVLYIGAPAADRERFSGPYTVAGGTLRCGGTFTASPASP